MWRHEASSSSNTPSHNSISDTHNSHCGVILLCSFVLLCSVILFCSLVLFCSVLLSSSPLLCSSALLPSAHLFSPSVILSSFSQVRHEASIREEMFKECTFRPTIKGLVITYPTTYPPPSHLLARRY